MSRLVHVAIGANRVPEVLDWGTCGLVAYAAGRLVAIYDPQVSLHDL